MKNISNLLRSLETLRNSLIKEVQTINRTIEIIKDTKKGKICPACLSADLRYMLNDKIFCRACGYDNRKQSLKELEEK